MPETQLAQTNFSEPQTTVSLRLKEDEAARLGINNVQLETTLALRYGNGLSMARVWEGNYDIPVTLKSEQADSASFFDLKDELVPVAGGLSYVPLRQLVEMRPCYEDGQIVRRNGVYTITVMSDVRREVNPTAFTEKLMKRLEKIPLPQGVELAYGGDREQDNENLPPIMGQMLAGFVLRRIAGVEDTLGASAAGCGRENMGGGA